VCGYGGHEDRLPQETLTTHMMQCMQQSQRNSLVALVGLGRDLRSPPDMEEDPPLASSEGRNMPLQNHDLRG